MSSATLAHLAAISNESGPGLFLRCVVLGSIVGVLLLVWIIARANRHN